MALKRDPCILVVHLKNKPPFKIAIPRHPTPPLQHVHFSTTSEGLMGVIPNISLKISQMQKAFKLCYTLMKTSLAKWKSQQRSPTQNKVH